MLTVCFLLIFLNRHGVQSKFADVKIHYGFVFLLLMVYQACCEYSLGHMSGITRSPWCHVTPLYICMYTLSLVVFIAVLKVISKICSDLYVQELIKVRYARFNYGKHLAHLISAPLEALSALVQTTSESATHSLMSSRNSAVAGVKVDSFFKDNDEDLAIESTVLSQYTRMKEPAMRPLVPQAINAGIGEINTLLKLLQTSSSDLIDIAGPTEFVPFLESIYIDYIDRCEEAKLELMVPSDDSVAALGSACVAVDLEKMRLAVTDILDYSLSHSKSGFMLAIAAEVVTTDDIPRVDSTFGTFPTLADYRQEFVELRIQDSSIGLDKEELDQIFDPQSRKHPHLIIIKRLLELHDGAVFVQSPGAGQGMEINLYLPIINVNMTRKKPQQQLDNLENQPGSYVAMSKIIPADISMTSATIAETLLTTAKSARDLLVKSNSTKEHSVDMSTQQKFKYIPNLNGPAITGGSPRSKPSSYAPSSFGSSHDDDTEERFDVQRYALMKMGTDGHGGSSAMKPSPVLAFDIDANYGFDVSDLNMPPGSQSNRAVETSFQRDENPSFYRAAAPAGSGRYAGGSARYAGIDPMGLMASLALAAGGSRRVSVASTPRQGRESTMHDINGAVQQNSRRTSANIGMGQTAYGGIDPMGLMASLNSLAQPVKMMHGLTINVDPEEGGSIFRQNSRTGHASHRSVRRIESGDNDGGFDLSSAFANNMLRQNSRSGAVSISRHSSFDAGPSAMRAEFSLQDFDQNPGIGFGLFRQNSGQSAPNFSNQPSIVRNNSGETNASGRFMMGSRASSGGLGSEKSYMTGGSIPRAEEITPVGTGMSAAGSMRRGNGDQEHPGMEMRRNSRTGQVEISPAGTGMSAAGSMRRGNGDQEHPGMEMRRNSRTGQVEISPAGTGMSAAGSMRRGNGDQEHPGMEMRRNSRTGQVEISPAGTGMSAAGSMRRGMGSRASSGGLGSEKSYMTGGSIPRAEEITPVGTGMSAAGSMRRGNGDQEHPGMEMRRNSRTGQVEISPAGTGMSAAGSMRRTSGVGYSNQHSYHNQDSGEGNSGNRFMMGSCASTGAALTGVPHGEIANMESLSSGVLSGYSSGRSAGYNPGPSPMFQTPYNYTPAEQSRVNSSHSHRPDVGIGANTPNSFSPPGTYQGGAGSMRTK